MNSNRNWIPWQGSVTHPSTGSVNFKAVIQPIVHAPHVGADSPRYMEPGRRTEVIYFDLYDEDGEERQLPCMDADVASVRELIRLDYLRRRDEDDAVLAAVARRVMEVVA